MANAMSQTLASNSTISHYRIISIIGARGMCEVYPAEDTRLHRKGVLKILRAEVAPNQERMCRFNFDTIVGSLARTALGYLAFEVRCN